MNKVCISGRLVRDPSVHSFQNQNQLTTIFIANNIYYGDNEKTGFFKVNVWGNLGKIIAEHCKTGTKLFVTGRLEQSQYQNEDGKTIYDVSINMEHFDFGERSLSSESLSSVDSQQSNT